LIGQLSNANQRVAGLLFHHLKRVSSFESVNQMGAANLATMFGPTVLRRKPKFNVANMMEFVDNTWLMKAVELCIDRASDVFGPPSEFTVAKLLKIIRDRTAERLSIESTSTSSIDKELPCTPASSSNTPNVPTPSASTSGASSKSAAREAFFSDMSGESTRALQAMSPPVLKVSYSRSEQPSPSPFDRKSISSRTSEDSGKSTTPLYHPSVTLTIHKSPTVSETPTSLATKSQESLPESSGGSSSGGGGLKRLLSTKAQNLHQKLQNFSAESSSRAGRVFNTRKLLHSSSLRNHPSQASSRNSPSSASTTPHILKEKTLEVDDCSYIDTGR
uniref:Rho-GAP domain-containing protein n=1 Tax=Rodentolepis nana TaxID=102285 RepID=A0A0R3TQQ8_RODNA